MEKLTQDLASPEYTEGVEQGFWDAPDRKDNLVYISLHAPDGRIFVGRFECSDYETQPIYCLFVKPDTREIDTKYWPDGDSEFEKWIKFKANPPFICWPRDRGAIEVGGHRDWQALKEWQQTENKIVAHLDFLRRMLHVRANGYLRQK